MALRLGVRTYKQLFNLTLVKVWSIGDLLILESNEHLGASL